jgi:pimeloyl-ACP methyl ester carboxylesterase
MSAGHPPHAVDRFFGFLSSRARLFSGGWGDEEIIAAFETPPFPEVPAAVEPTWGDRLRRGPDVLDGVFQSPIERLPAEVRRGRVRWFRAASPRQWGVVVLASAGDEGFWMRSRLFGPLAKEGIDVFLLENPFYGLRRPHGQRGSQIRTVAEQGIMNFATIEEARGLVRWLRSQGWSKLGFAGYSMGGFMAATATSLTHEPIAAAVMAAGASPATVFTKGFVSRAIDFAALGGAPERAGEARARLAGLFDKTDLARFPRARHPEAAILVACERDGFVAPEIVEALHAHWTGSELRRIDAGHVSAVFRHADALRSAVRDSLARLAPEG